MTRMKVLTAVTLLALSLFPNALQLIAQDESVDDEALISQRKLPRTGRLGLPLKTPVILEGFVIEGPFKGFEGGPNLVIQRIDGKAAQKYIRIRLWKDADPEYPGTKPDRRSTFPIGLWLRLNGHEDGEIIGGEKNPDPDGLPLQTYGGPTYIPTFVVQKLERIEPIALHPQEFVDRKALFEGTALHIGGKPYLVGNGWLFAFPKVAIWPNEFLGKRIEVIGTVRASAESGSYESDDVAARLVSLKDQIGRTISLRGTTKSMNGRWWFDYRGHKIHVEKMDRLSSDDYHFKPTQVDGVLEVAMLPAAEYNGDERLAPRFIVRQATWKRIEPLLTPEIGDFANTRSGRN